MRQIRLPLSVIGVSVCSWSTTTVSPPSTSSPSQNNPSVVAGSRRKMLRHPVGGKGRDPPDRRVSCSSLRGQLQYISLSC